MLIIESILSGIWATVIMDVLAKMLAKRNLIFPFISQEELGRWFFYMLRGKLTHKDIRTTSAVKNEKIWYFISHYLIGIILAGFYLFLAALNKEFSENAWLAVIFGTLTVILPWFWLLPATGLGFMAGKSKNRKMILRTNLINHTNFGIGLYLWMILFQYCS